MLQSKSFLTFYSNLSQESQEEVFEEILKTKTLMDILKHPVIVNGYKSALLERHDYTSRTFLRHLISTTTNSELLYHLYLDFKWRDSYDEILSDYIVERSWKWCIQFSDEKILLLDNWLYERGHFNFNEYPTPVEFNFKRDIIDRNIQESSIYILSRTKTISNPEWNMYGPNPPGLLQCIPYGQKEITIYKFIVG